MKKPRLWVVEVRDNDRWWPLQASVSEFRSRALAYLREARGDDSVYPYRTVQYERA